MTQMFQSLKPVVGDCSLTNKEIIPTPKSTKKISASFRASKFLTGKSSLVGNVNPVAAYSESNLNFIQRYYELF